MNNPNFSKAEQAVSPVVATLLLILVAAGAAIGVGVFLNGFQKNSQEKVSSETPTDSLSIGGSSTVWELTEKALPQWKSEHPSVAINNQEGGSGAGKIAICKGTVDIGATSSRVDPSGKPGQDLLSCPDFNGDGIKDAGAGLQVTTVGYDGVVMSSFGTTHCTALAFSKAQVQALYFRNGAGENIAYPAVGAGTPIAAAATPLTWDNLVTAGSCTGTGGTQDVLLSSRSDNSGTEDGFCKLLLGKDKDGTYCDKTNNNLVELKFPAAKVNPKVGNEGIDAYLRATPDAVSFIGFGFVNGVTGYTTGTLDGFAPTAAAIKSGGIALEQGVTCTASATQYCGARSLQYITAGAPSATEQLFLDFMTQTTNNLNFNKAAGYVSLYA